MVQALVTNIGKYSISLLWLPLYWHTGKFYINFVDKSMVYCDRNHDCGISPGGILLMVCYISIHMVPICSETNPACRLPQHPPLFPSHINTEFCYSDDGGAVWDKKSNTGKYWLFLSRLTFTENLNVTFLFAVSTFCLNFYFHSSWQLACVCCRWLWCFFGCVVGVNISPWSYRNSW